MRMCQNLDFMKLVLPETWFQDGSFDNQYLAGPIQNRGLCSETWSTRPLLPSTTKVNEITKVNNILTLLVTTY